MNNQIGDEDLHRLTEAKQLIEKNPTMSVTEIASKIGWNKTSLTYYFKLQYFLTIKDFQLQLKMTFAKELLEKTRIPIAIIATKTGYDNPSSFSVAFRRETGMTPLRWRNSKSDKD